MTEWRTIALQYGESLQKVRLPAPNFCEALRMREVASAEDPQATIGAALDAPIGCPPLEDVARGAQQVLILIDDLTRPTPAHMLVPPVLQRLDQAGVPREGITIMVATGTHRPLTPEEIARKVGPDIVAAYRCENHNYLEDDLLDLGETEGGVPVTVNRRVVDADFVIAVGNIVPHRYCGWAGGAKMVQPGVSGEATTAGTHLMITKAPGARLGVLENQVRHEIEAVAERAGLRFIVNTVLDRGGNIVGVVAGDFRKAFRRGVREAAEIYSAPFSRQVDIVVASAYPSDMNLWQAGKALYAADLVVKDGGVIILASPCYEGIGEHGEFGRLLQYDYETIEAMLARNEIQDRIGAAAALAVALVSARADIYLVTDTITEWQAAQMKLSHYSTVQRALDAALAAQGDGAQVTVLHEATELLPLRGGELDA
jgi:nickel-dependent lactate racemase